MTSYCRMRNGSLRVSKNELGMMCCEAKEEQEYHYIQEGMEIAGYTDEDYGDYWDAD